MTKKDFYDRCAEILNIKSTYVDATRKTRWSGREPDSGRFPWCGLIRMYNENYIHVSLRRGILAPNPDDPCYEIMVNTVFKNPEDVFKLLIQSMRR